MSGRMFRPGPINMDSGGNRFFLFQDPEGNTIEVCTEPR
jgi:predicted enzyme related to lactoylglutathione lyase